MRTVALKLLALGLSAAGGYWVPTSPGAANRRPTSTPPPPADVSPHSAPLPLTLEVVPEAVATNAGRDHLALSVRLRHRLKGVPLNVAVHADIVDDLGNPVVEGQFSPSRSLDGNIDETSFPSSIDAPSQDGYYVARFTAAAVGKTEEHTTGLGYYFVARAGRVTPLEYSEWFAGSRARIGRLIGR